MSTIINANKADFKDVVLVSKVPVLVDFWASWCQPCAVMGPILEELSDELRGTVSVVKVNVEEADNLKLARQYSIQSIPNMKLFRDGKVIGEFIGLTPKQTLKSEIEKAVAGK